MLANFASAQQADAMFGFGTLVSPGADACGFSSSAQNFVCPEKGGLYTNIGADVIFHRRLVSALTLHGKLARASMAATAVNPSARSCLISTASTSLASTKRPDSISWRASDGRPPASTDTSPPAAAFILAPAILAPTTS